MKKLHVIFLKQIRYTDRATKISLRLDKAQRHSLSYAPWPAYPNKPHVQFAVGYNDENIFLKYYVREKFIKAVYGQINEPVYKDACVEFFVLFDEKGYYNFEFNCIGTALAGFGKERASRERLSDEVIRQIKYRAIVQNEKADTVYWELTLIIPLAVFVHHSFASLRGKTCRANFYKCGDELPEPHYLTWSDIRSPKPDFHLPEFFGTLVFD